MVEEEEPPGPSAEPGPPPRRGLALPSFKLERPPQLPGARLRKVRPRGRDPGGAAADLDGRSRPDGVLVQVLGDGEPPPADPAG